MTTIAKFKQSGSGAVNRKITEKLSEYVSVKDFGAVGDGVADDSAAIQAALTASTHVRFGPGSYKINSSVTIPSNRFIDLASANIIADTGATPLFRFVSASEQLYIFGGGGIVTGTASSFLFCQGTTNQPTAVGQYARQIRLEGIQINSETIDVFLDFSNAVRQVFIDKCMSYTPSGINGNGKCVEVKVSKSIIYSSSGGAGTYGVKLRSPGNTTYYNEGWHFTDCTIDNFAKTFDVTDIFVLTVTGGYVGSAPSGYAFDFGMPTSSKCDHITLSGFTTGSKIRFAPSGGLLYHANISNVTFTSISSVNLQCANNAAGISIRNVKFESSTSGIAIECVSNNATIVIDGIDCDSTFIAGVQVKGTAGANCSVSNVSYSGSGDSLYVERPVLVKNVAVNSANVSALQRQFNPGDIVGTTAVAGTIATINISCAKGETGFINFSLGCSGMNAGTQRFDLALPAGMSVPTGTGWSSVYVYPSAAAGLVTASIPYYCTADITGQDLAIVNAVGNTVSVDYHSRFGIVRTW
jgi:Pectate lyase superfamily protein